MPRAASCPTAACYALPDRRVKAGISLAPRSSSNSTGFTLLSPESAEQRRPSLRRADAPDPQRPSAVSPTVATKIFAYTPSGGPDPAWAPHVTSCPHRIEAGHSYTLYGRQLNGLSQAVSYGDDATAATNYPLVRIRHALRARSISAAPSTTAPWELPRELPFSTRL